MLKLPCLGGLLVAVMALPLPRAIGATEPIIHTAMCDASAGVALAGGLFAVANDEDNVIRVYDSQRSGPPVGATDFSRFLGVDPKHPEADFEGCARVGDRVYWITSHGRNKDAEFRESRHRFFATDVKREATIAQLVPVGIPNSTLLRELMHDERLKEFKLGAASQLEPKALGGLNIEGLTATPQGHLLIGFRNPIPGRRALLVPLHNPDEVIQGRAAQLGNPVLLNLDGLGVRDITWTGRHYYIVGGPIQGNAGSRVYQWSGRDERPAPVPHGRFPGMNPEAIIVHPHVAGRIHVISDDGDMNIQGVECKNLKDPGQKRFRSFWLDVPVQDAAGTVRQRRLSAPSP